MAELPISLIPGFVAHPTMPVPDSKPMGKYSIPEEYENIPLIDIYSKKLGREQFEKLVDVVKWQETKNNHYDENGVIQIGKDGEVGLMQIKPLGDLGGGLKGVRRPVLENEDLNERIGRIHLINILKDKNVNYHIPSAIMAWNRGLGKHKEWIDAGRNKEKLPSYTKDYLITLRKRFPKAFKSDTLESSPKVDTEVKIPTLPVVEQPANLAADKTEQSYYRPYDKIFPELYDKDFSSKYGNRVDQNTMFNAATEAFIKYSNEEDFRLARKHFLDIILNNSKPYMDFSMTGKPIDYSPRKVEKKNKSGFVSTPSE
jgi:hypothetical protein